jgi:hypothetical protein
MRLFATITTAVLAVCAASPVMLALSLATRAAAQTTAPADAVSTPAASLAVRTLTPAQAQADVALMRRALETIHPGLYRRATKARMDAAFADLESTVRQPISELELYRRISLLLAEIRCNHTKAEQTAAIEAWRQDNPSHLPFRFRILEGRMIVDSSDPAQPGLARGTEVVGINGRPVAALFKVLGAYAPIDGDTVWARATNLANDGDLMGSDFDHFYPYVFGFTPRFDLQVRDSDAAPIRTVSMAAIPFKTWRALPRQGGRYRNNFSESTTWRMLDAETAYLRVETFVNYRKPVDASGLYDKVFSDIKAAGATRLILDLRDNGGGSRDATYTLADHLSRKPFVWNRMVRFKTVRVGNLADVIETWGDRAETFSPPMDGFMPAPGGGYDAIPPRSPDELLPRVPAPSAFAGPVTILTSPVNGSGSTMLIAKLRDLGRVRLVGERSGGSGDGPTAGQIFNVMLPNSAIAVRVPNAFNAMQVRRFEPRGGVTPDVLAVQTVADFRAGRDTALLAAVADRGPPLAALPAPNAKPVLARMAGAWRGTLEYRDFSSDKRVTLPTVLDATLVDDGQALRFAFTYDDGPGKTVRGGYTVSLDLAEAILTKDGAEGVDRYRITAPTDLGARRPIRWTLWGRGDESGAPVDVKETLTVSASTLTLLRETRPRGGAFAFRNSYVFSRARD